jgi:hypothetical protein
MNQSFKIKTVGWKLELIIINSLHGVTCTTERSSVHLLPVLVWLARSEPVLIRQRSRAFSLKLSRFVNVGLKSSMCVNFYLTPDAVTCVTNPDLQRIRFDYLLLFLKELVRTAGIFIPMWVIFVRSRAHTHAHARTHTHTHMHKLYNFSVWFLYLRGPPACLA